MSKLITTPEDYATGRTKPNYRHSSNHPKVDMSTIDMGMFNNLFPKDAIVNTPSELKVSPDPKMVPYDQFMELVKKYKTLHDTYETLKSTKSIQVDNVTVCPVCAERKKKNKEANRRARAKQKLKAGRK